MSIRLDDEKLHLFGFSSQTNERGYKGSYIFISLLILGCPTHRKTFGRALTCVAALLRFWGYRLQAILENLHINPNLSHRDYFISACPCLCGFVPACLQGYESFHVCVRWLNRADRLEDNSLAKSEGHPGK